MTELFFPEKGDLVQFENWLLPHPLDGYYGVNYYQNTQNFTGMVTKVLDSHSCRVLFFDDFTERMCFNSNLVLLSR